MAYLHSLDPFAVSFGNGFGIRWYGLAYLVGFLLGYWLMLFLSRKKLSPAPPDVLGDFAFNVAMGTIIGGRLGYCLFYAPELLTSFSTKFPFWGVFAISQGGMSSHGGIAGIAITCVVFGYMRGISLLHIGDLCTYGGTIGIFFGRIANFINGELVGRPCAEDFRWGVKFPQDILSWPNHDPENLPGLISTVNYLNVPAAEWTRLVETYQYDKRAWNELQDILFRIIEAVQQGNQVVANSLRPLLLTRHPSQLYAAVLEGLLVFLALCAIWYKPRKPGVIAGWFFVLYSTARIVSEQFRVPDLHIGFQWLGLTRGQWLSVLMLMIGAGFLVFWSRRPVEKIGGWEVLLKRG